MQVPIMKLLKKIEFLSFINISGGRCGGVECTSTEECKVNSELQIYECVCRENHIRDSQHQCVPSEATCGGGKCVENAECVFDDHINTMFCACKPGYIGDGN